MAYDPAKAKAYDQAIAAGATEEQALAAAGISDNDIYNYSVGIQGNLEPAFTGPPARPNETIVPAGQSIDYGEDTGPTYSTTPVSSRTTTTSQTSTTGGGVTTRTVVPTQYTDNAQSTELRGEYDSLLSQKNSRAAQLKAEGKSGAEILRDPEYRRLSNEAIQKDYEADQARSVSQNGQVLNSYTPGSDQTVYQQTVPNDITQNTGYDPYANYEDINAIDAPGYVQNNSDITDFTNEDNASLGYTPLTEEQIQALDNPEPVTDPSSGNFVFDEETGELLPADSAAAQDYFAQQNRVEVADAAPVGGSYTAYYDVETGEYNVRDDATGEDVATGLSESAADSTAAAYSIGDPSYGDPQAQQDADNPRDYGPQTDPGDAQLITSKVQVARQQKTIQEQRKKINEQDWRVRLRLAPQANYLYNDPSNQVLAPLSSTGGTDGVIFPYTPKIDITYQAVYNQETLTHSNYLQYFYQGSSVQAIQISGAVFTAQDTKEANYMLAVIHFLRACTKMFYGQDNEAGSPPPLVYLSGYGTYQFNEHPCVIQQFNYNLPDNVDYIRAGSPNVANNPFNLNQNRTQQATTAQGILSGIASTIGGPLARLASSGLQKGATPMSQFTGRNLQISEPTYVPTRLDVSMILLPVVSRRAVSQEFSLKGYANGALLRKGFW